MQAPQSNTALDKPTSPFTAPIQAARKYLERQKGSNPGQYRAGPAMDIASDIAADIATVSSVDFDPGESGYSRHVGGILSTAELRNKLNSEEHLTGLHGDSGGIDVPDAVETDAACAPDADAVRAAIFRLARESKWSQRITARGFEAEVALLSPGQPSNGLRASDTLSGDEVLLRSPDSPALTEGQEKSKDFEEVALWVWSESPEGVAAAVDNVAVEDKTFTGASAAAIYPQSPTPAATGWAAVEAVSEAAAPAANLGAAEGSALAHDAGNLLSAMGLYSELLCLSGVLQASHRHYADDLKLLVGRSHVLIERLLRVSRSRETDETHREVWEPDSLRTASLPSDPQPLRDGSPPHNSIGGGPAGIVSRTPPRPAAGVLDGRLPRAGRAVQNLFESAPFPATFAGFRSARRTRVRPRAGGGVGSSMETFARGLASRAASGEERGIHHPDTSQTSTPDAALENPDVQKEQAILSELLGRWSSLLSTIAHGAIKVELGSLTELPIDVPCESIERIVVNLVRNATEAIRDGGAIRIGAGAFERGSPARDGWGERSGRTMVLRVDDSGCGMSEQQLQRVLGGTTASSETSFYSPGYGSWAGGGFGSPDYSHDQRAEGASEIPRRGLGLRIVRELVAASNGEIFIQSQPGKGTRIEIQWPVAETSTAGAEIGNTASAVPAIQREAGVWMTKDNAAIPALRREGLHLAVQTGSRGPGFAHGFDGEENGQERGAIAC